MPRVGCSGTLPETASGATPRTAPQLEPDMASLYVPRPVTREEHVGLAASIRRATRRDDLEMIGLLAGILGILLAAVVIFAATSPVP